MARRKLREHQMQALAYSLCVTHPALFMEMRLGKTLVTIRSICTRKLSPVLIVCPFSAFYGWIDDLSKDNLTRQGIVLLDGTKKQRVEALAAGLATGARWFLFNKEGHRVLPEIADAQWEAVVVDESTFLKSPKSQVSKFFSKYFRDVKHRYILTGTPMTESELDYFQQLRFLNPAILGERNYWEFRNKYFRPSGFHNFSMTKKGESLIARRIAENCFFMKRGDVNLGGTKIYERRICKQTPAFHRIQNELIKMYLLTDGKGNEIASTLYATTKFVWLRRLCGGFLDGKLVYPAKIKELVELVTGELSGEPAVIWAVFAEELDLIYERLTKLGFACARISGSVKQVQRREVQRLFQEGSLQYVIAQPECFKYGVKLSAANTEIYYSTPMGLETRQQSEDRVIDVEKKDSALIIDIIVNDSVDQDMYESLQDKESAELMWRRIINRLQGEMK